MAAFQFYGIEVHDHSIWEVERMYGVIATMQRYGYNALILHENDLLDACTQIEGAANFGVSDLRWKKVSNRLAWLNRLVARLDVFGAKLFLEIKEPSYHDYIFEIYPDLIDADGRVDPTSKRWTEFCSRKTEQLLQNVPGIGGFIVNLSSPESRVSLQDYLSDRGQTIDLDEWLSRMIDAFATPLLAAGKDIYVRDFAYTKDLQARTLKAIDGKEGRVGASIKITAHDYFPRFPDNNIARQVAAPKLIEFEAFGEHMGWGLLPNCRVQEFIDRMAFVRDIGARGAFIRISWEAITGPHALDNLSDVNVYAMAAIMDGEDDALEITRDWLQARYSLDAASPAAATLAQCMLDSWHVVAAAYWRESVFPRHSRLPASWQEGWHSMLTSGMGNRHLKAEDLRITAAEKEELFAEKAKAVALADDIWARVRAVVPQLPATLAQQVQDSFGLLPLYARMFDFATRGTVLAAEGETAGLAELRQALDGVAKDAAGMLAERPDAPHSLGVLFDPAHIRTFAASLT